MECQLLGSGRVAGVGFVSPPAKPNPEINYTSKSAQELCSGNAVFNAVSEFEE